MDKRRILVPKNHVVPLQQNQIVKKQLALDTDTRRVVMYIYIMIPPRLK